jgi:molybdenum cofactor cytidylyltransferase
MISAIVLSAGKSSRMGSINKMLLPFDKSTVIGTVVSNLCSSLVDEIIITENSDQKISEHLDAHPKIKVVINTNAAKGLTSSIQCGVNAASDESSGYLICLGDMPLITENEYNLLINYELKINSKVILQSSFNGKRGNPIFFSSHFKPDILALEALDGCKPLIIENQTCVIDIPFTTNNCHQDIDTMEDYKKVKY